jgi:osmotically-inducible protein OsmY
MKTDSQIQTDVQAALKFDPSVTHELIGVSTLQGVVTLSGTVPGYSEKWAAEKITQKVSGVKAVVEKIEVRLLGTDLRNDQEIAQAALSSLKWNYQVPSDSVQVRVQNGFIQLSGEVEWDFQRNAAKRCVEKLIGVKGVSDEITLKFKTIQPNTVKENIREALKTDAQEEAARISVEVLGNKVILSGEVNTFSEKEDARYAAWMSPGVLKVENWNYPEKLDTNLSS